MNNILRSALVIGKFLPPHAGHQYVIEFAIKERAKVEVIVCDLPAQIPPAAIRADWLRRIHPEIRVTVVPDICGQHEPSPCSFRCSERWANYLEGLKMGPWQAVYGSDPYINEFGRRLGATSILVDQARLHFPVSGTAVRANLAGNWTHLHPIVRAGLTRRVVCLGAESTGTTTLAGDLAGALLSRWVPEYGRWYSEKLAALAGSISNVTWHSSDFEHIADQQEALEEKVIRRWVENPDRWFGDLGPLIVCDTDLLATAVWHRRYCGELAEGLIERAANRPPLLYVLTSPLSVPFEQDGLRDGEHLRQKMTDWFREVLRSQPAPWVEVTGTRNERKCRVLKELRTLTEAGNTSLGGTGGDAHRHNPEQA